MHSALTWLFSNKERKIETATNNRKPKTKIVKSRKVTHVPPSYDDDRLIRMYDKSGRQETFLGGGKDPDPTDDDKLIAMIDGVACDVWSQQTKALDKSIFDLLDDPGHVTNAGSQRLVAMKACVSSTLDSMLSANMCARVKPQPRLTPPGVVAVGRRKSIQKSKVREAYMCEICGAVYKSASSLNIHVRKKHRPLKYVCPTCNKGFPYACLLRQHQMKHTGEQPFICHLCGRGFSLQTALNRHLQEHTGIKRHACPHCPKRFFHKGPLSVHILKHTGETPYVCQDCFAGFRTNYALTVHKRRHTGEKPFSCYVCSKSFSRVSHLRRHERMHSGVKPHACDLCDGKFTRLANLRAHMRSLHGRDFT